MVFLNRHPKEGKEREEEGVRKGEIREWKKPRGREMSSMAEDGGIGRGKKRKGKKKDTIKMIMAGKK